MSSINRVTIYGALGRDPESRFTAQGVQVVTLRVATNRNYKDATGHSIEETDWHTVVAFGKSAELAAKYLRKGSKALIEGYLRTRKWKDKDGNDRYSTEVVTERLHLTGSRADAPHADAEEPAGGAQASGAQASGDDTQHAEALDVPF